MNKNMKIVFVIGAMEGGGAQRTLVLIANELSQRGFEVTILTYSPGSAYEINKRIKHLSMFSLNEMREMNLVNKIFRRTVFYFRLIKYLKKIQPDIVISFMKGMNRKVIPVGKILNIPIIVSEHTNYKAGMNLLTWIERRFLYKLADAVVVLTEYDYENFYKNFLDNAIVIPNPVTFNSIQAVKSKDKIIIAAGNLDRWQIKGFDNLLKIFSEVIKMHPDWKLRIAGSGELGKNYLKKLVIKYNIENNVEFLGFCRNINKEFEKSSIFILSSRFEGFPMVLLEAMSQGCACISYDCISGPNEIITNGVDGILVENQNLYQMIEKINFLIENNDLMIDLSKNATKKVQKFSTKTIVDRWVALIENISMKCPR